MTSVGAVHTFVDARFALPRPVQRQRTPWSNELTRLTGAQPVAVEADHEVYLSDRAVVTAIATAGGA